MPDFDAKSLLDWFHFISLVLAGGTMPVCLLLSGFEDSHEDIRGLSAVIWKKMIVWGMRFAILFGVALLFLSLKNGGKPFSQPYLMFKIGLAPFLVLLCETTPKSLARGKRGTALLATALFVLTSFVASNGAAFSRPAPGLSSAPASAILQADETDTRDLPPVPPSVTTASPPPANSDESVAQPQE